MKNSLEKLLWGVILVIFGVALAGRVLGLFQFNLFFSGWWTLFIIIPSAVSLISGNNIASSIGGLAIGFLLLMTQTGALNWQEFGKMLIAVVLVTLGFSFLFPENKNHNKSDRKEQKKTKDDSKYQENKYQENKYQENKYQENKYQADNYKTDNDKKEKYEAKTEQKNYVDKEYKDVSGDGEQNQFHENMNGVGNRFTPHNEEKNSGNEDRNGQRNIFRQYTGFFSVQKEQFVDEVFGGAVINAILGGVELDLRNAVFLNDTIIDITCIMGGVDIFVPTNVKVVVNCTPIMGGVECYVKNSFNQAQTQYTLFIKGTCLMGGVEIK